MVKNSPPLRVSKSFYDWGMEEKKRTGLNFPTITHLVALHLRQGDGMIEEVDKKAYILRKKAAKKRGIGVREGSLFNDFEW